MADEYIVWCTELGHESPEDGSRIRALSHEDAAKTWARREDACSADYWIAIGGGTEVFVEDMLGTQKRFHVRGEQDINYYTRDLSNG